MDIVYIHMHTTLLLSILLPKLVQLILEIMKNILLLKFIVIKLIFETQICMKFFMGNFNFDHFKSVRWHHRTKQALNICVIL